MRKIVFLETRQVRTSLRAQSLLHPVCAQQPPESEVIGGKPVQPVCHAIARSCKQNPDCRSVTALRNNVEVEVAERQNVEKIFYMYI
jgi:hypothetical protein